MTFLKVYRQSAHARRTCSLSSSDRSDKTLCVTENELLPSSIACHWYDGDRDHVRRECGHAKQMEGPAEAVGPPHGFVAYLGQREW